LQMASSGFVGKMKIEGLWCGGDGLRRNCFVSYSALGGILVATAPIVIRGLL